MDIPMEPELVLDGGGSISGQIRDQVRAYVLRGHLRPGEQLPTVRAVAAELAVNPAAVERAYAELEREGWVTTADGSGTFVAAPAAAEHRRMKMDQLCANYLEQATEGGFSRAEALAALHAYLQRS